MSELNLVKVESGDRDYPLFAEFPGKIYPEGSQRFIFGNDPVSKNCEGTYIALKGDSVVARFALYINPELSYEGLKTISFGSFECVEDAEVAQGVLELIQGKAKELGFEYLLGPMEGSTWNNYRFSDHNKRPNFFMEPYHHAYYAGFFKENGFDTISHYYSNLDTKLEFSGDDLTKAEDHFRSLGITFRQFDMANPEKELIKIAAFSNKAFQHNFLFTPIKEQDFADKYLKYIQLFDPDFIIIAERENKDIVAICFSMPDHFNSNGKSLIIKSLARLPDKDLKGIGAYVIFKTYQKAIEKGYENVIHALMIKDNSSVDLSEKYHGEDYKSYSLFGKQL